MAGLKVYETVKLSVDRFGNVGIQSKAYAKPTDEYYYEFEDHYYRRWNPTFVQHRSWIVRRSDRKILGEDISYGRGGGGLPGPWHGSSFSCPDPIKQPSNIEKLIFLKAE